MKKILLFVLAALCLVGCGKPQDDEDSIVGTKWRANFGGDGRYYELVFVSSTTATFQMIAPAFSSDTFLGVYLKSGDSIIFSQFDFSYTTIYDDGVGGTEFTLDNATISGNTLTLSTHYFLKNDRLTKTIKMTRQ